MGSSRNNSEKTVVTFKDIVTIHLIPSLSQESNIPSRYLTCREYDRIKAVCLRIVEMMDCGVSEEQIQKIGETTRGLEVLTINYVNHGFRRRCASQQSVFMLQDEARRYKHPSITAEHIAKFYARLSAKSRYNALNMGLNDQTFVLQESFEERKHLQQYTTHICSSFEEACLDSDFSSPSKRFSTMTPIQLRRDPMAIIHGL